MRLAALARAFAALTLAADTVFVEDTRTRIDVPSWLRTCIFTPARGTFTPTYGSSGYQ